MSGWLGEQDARRDAIATGGKTGTNEFYLAFESFSIFPSRSKRKRSGNEKVETNRRSMIKSMRSRTNTNGKTVREIA